MRLGVPVFPSEKARSRISKCQPVVTPALHNHGMRIYDWKTIQQFHDAGYCAAECQRIFGFSHTAWVKARNRGELTQRFQNHGGGRPVGLDDRRKTYDWAQIRAYYDEGHTYTECQARFGFTSAAWEKARHRGQIKTRPPGMPIDELLRRAKSRTHLKMRLIGAGLLKNECQQCGLTSWRGAAINMHIDHVNGIKNDHRLENLRMLCPNCHSQTPTYGGKNARRLKLARAVESHVV